MNDTIVVNQPRLTTEEEQVITIPNDNGDILMEETGNEQVNLFIIYNFFREASCVINCNFFTRSHTCKYETLERVRVAFILNLIIRMTGFYYYMKHFITWNFITC